ncbi:hypothetical protein RIF25_09305 [Thermosynechococcaceae cyanobacterium BACA0444]|uniref:Lipoprotein n=1 Tax=Pseudocalidococcus azoricus BACA0444 TaxID=2918990 RepID=A0AAE4FRM1_9CYAN|nr:hypothetical protein [Pseudocalidococcus azoricus]MDS3861004.1 hypothetical protein [Pseudocalidococcus azoricus BACA0444]
MFRTVPNLSVAISLFLGTGLTGCFGFFDANSKALAPYATKTLIPGQGLGNLELGKTTLAGFVNQIGAGQVTLIYGDEQGIELNFQGSQAAFLFIVTRACQDQAGVLRTHSEIYQNLKAFLAKYPACGELKLSSLSVAEPFFRGQTNRGVKLGDPLATANGQGEPLNRPGQFVAGADDSNFREFRGGIYIHYPNTGPTPEELFRGQPLSAQRLEEIQNQAQDPKISRITIFIPND